jgi:hypothetical protein
VKEWEEDLEVVVLEEQVEEVLEVEVHVVE